jgi:hypothetical protein
MSTGNFYYKNASHVFAICMNEDGEGMEEWQVNDELDYIKSEMENVKGFTFYPGKDWRNDGLRSYPSKNIGELRKEKSYGGVSCEVVIEAFATSGYYEGACLDWEIKVLLEGNECDEPDPSDFSYYGRNINTGMGKILAEKANKWIENTKEEMITELENVFTKVATYNLRCLGHASNGEAFYQKIA